MGNNKIDQSNKLKSKGLKVFGLIILLLVVNIAAYFFSFQLDLTKDKRYSITPATKELLKNLNEKISVQVYLTGEDLPAAFKQLEKSTIAMLDQFQTLSKNKISYQFIDPLDDNEEALQTLNEFRMSGLPITVSAGKKGTSQKMVFPWALVTKESKDGKREAFPVFLQESNTPELSRTVLNKSEMLLEYNLANAIHQLSKKEQFSIAYLTGNGETFDVSISAAMNTLFRFYTLDTFNLQQNIQIPLHYDVVMMNRPLTSFSEIEKFKIDQYLLSGKSLFITIDAVSGSLDSFDAQGQFNAMPIDLNLNDLFFNFGFRVNNNLIEDGVSSVGIPLSAQGNNGSPVLYPWVYFPVLQNGSNHPIVKNLSGILTRFVSAIDLNTNDPEIKKTPLLVSSNYSSTLATPAPIILETAIVEKNPAEFTKRNLVAGLLLEGHFSSLYAERQPTEVRDFINQKQLNPIKKAKDAGKVIIVSDGQLLMNEFSEKNGPSDMGIFRFSDYRFDNKSFMLNSLEYLTDRKNLLAARSKDFHTRLLDPKRLVSERNFWQMINIGVPVLLIALLGLIYFVIRKRKYS